MTMGNYFLCLLRYRAARTTEGNVPSVENVENVNETALTAVEKRALQASIKKLSKNSCDHGQRFFLK
jgi:hypothetical protein